MPFKFFENLLKEVIILVAFVGFLANDESHVNGSSGGGVYVVVQGISPQVVLLRENIEMISTRNTLVRKLYYYRGKS